MIDILFVDAMIIIIIIITEFIVPKSTGSDQCHFAYITEEGNGQTAKEIGNRSPKVSTKNIPKNVSIMGDKIR
jgi:hypothetical protein